MAAGSGKELGLQHVNYTYQKALAIDNLSEVFYQRLMTAYKMLGRDSDAISAYQRCCKELSSRLGIPPSPATEEIYKNLKQRG
jgi:DNA-binding SARP family transcriptional activator